MIRNLIYIINSIIILLNFSCDNNKIVKDRLYSHISYLASDELKGRFPCTKGDSLATNYISQYFKIVGLKSYFSNESYLQPFPYLTDIKIEKSILKYSINEKEVELTPNVDYSIRSNSADGNKTAEVVFIGYGIHSAENGYDDFTKVDIENKIVIYYLVAPKDANEEVRTLSKKMNEKEIAKLAKELGAVAAAFVLPPPFPDKISSKKTRSMVSQRSSKLPLPNFRLAYEQFYSIMMGCGIDLDTINEKLKTSKSSLSLKIPNLEMTFNIKTNYVYKNTHNIIGYIPGQDTSKTILLGAHYDHIGINRIENVQDSIRNGADDNASGTSLILELAKYYSENKPATNLCFTAFGAEETGQNGSEYFIDHFPFKQNKLKFMLNFDMVGRLKNDSLYIYGVSSFPDSGDFIVKQSSNILYLNLKGKTFGGSDARPFLTINIPNLSLFTGMHSDYHGETDEIDKIDFDGLLKVYDFSISLINMISEKDYKLKE